MHEHERIAASDMRSIRSLLLMAMIVSRTLDAALAAPPTPPPPPPPPPPADEPSPSADVRSDLRDLRLSRFMRRRLPNSEPPARTAATSRPVHELAHEHERSLRPTTRPIDACRARERTSGPSLGPSDALWRCSVGAAKPRRPLVRLALSISGQYELSRSVERVVRAVSTDVACLIDGGGTLRSEISLLLLGPERPSRSSEEDDAKPPDDSIPSESTRLSLITTTRDDDF